MKHRMTPFKTCKRCGITQEREKFPISSVNKKTGTIIRKSLCNDCDNQYWIEWRIKNRDKVREYNQKPNSKRSREKYRNAHKTESRQYQIDHWDEIKAWNRVYSKTPKMREYGRNYKKKKREADINFKIYCDLKRRTILAIKGYVQNNIDILNLLGCDINFLRAYLESKFTEKMTWENHGLKGWHIDHIIPCAYFDMGNLIQRGKCFHYTNLQPLWAKDNLSKGAKFAA